MQRSDAQSSKIKVYVNTKLRARRKRVSLDLYNARSLLVRRVKAKCRPGCFKTRPEQPIRR